jgi:predicted component of type VI protein secretion system
MAESLVNTQTGEVVTGDEYVEMMLRNYEEADERCKEAYEERDRIKQVLYQYMDEQSPPMNGIPSETYTVRRKLTYDYQKNKAGFLPLLKILNESDLTRVYLAPTPADGQWHATRLKALAELYPQVGPLLEQVREAKVTLEFARRKNGK